MAIGKKKQKYKFYTTDNIDAKDATYNVIFGEMSNGKSFAVKMKILKNYLDGKGCGALIRRFDEQIKGGTGAKLMEDLYENDLGINYIDKLTKGKYNTIVYKGKLGWYLARNEEGKKILDDRPFCKPFALTLLASYDGTSNIDITTVLFDEFLTNKYYLIDEFLTFQKVLSKIIRVRAIGAVKIYMCGNTVDRNSPYIREMGLTNFLKMEQGQIDVYTYGESKLKVAVEYCGTTTKDNPKPSNDYFAFGNPKLSMIKTGSWEIDIYQHIIYSPKKGNDITKSIYLELDDELIQGDIMEADDMVIVNWHKKTTLLKEEPEDLIFTLGDITRPLSFRDPFTTGLKISEILKKTYTLKRWYYSDNLTGDNVKRYLDRVQRARYT